MDLNFNDLGLDEQYLQAVDRLGFQKTHTHPEHGYPYVLLEGRDVLGQAQTGTGKTAAFLLPILQNIQPVLDVFKHWFLRLPGNWPFRLRRKQKRYAQFTAIRICNWYMVDSLMISRSEN